PATWHSAWVSLAYTVGSVFPAFMIGLGTALLLNRAFPLRRWLRSLMLLPWAMPGVMVSIVFLWLFDASFGVVNFGLRSIGLVGSDIAWYTNESAAVLRRRLNRSASAPTTRRSAISTWDAQR